MGRILSPWNQQKPPLGSTINWSHPLSKGLVAAFLMNEGGGKFVQNIINKNNATNNNAQWLNNGLYFNGTDSQVIISKITISSQGSMSFLIRPTNTALTDDFIFDSDAGATRTLLYQHWLSANKQGLYICNAAIFEDASLITLLTSLVWQHIVITWDNSADTKVKVYKNGVLSFTSTTSVGTGSPTNFKLGSRNTNTGQWNGGLRNFLLYSRALSPSEIQQLYVEPYGFIEQRKIWTAEEIAAGLAPQRMMTGVGV